MKSNINKKKHQRSFKEILQRIKKIENDLNKKYKKNDDFSSSYDNYSMISSSLSNDELSLSEDDNSKSKFKRIIMKDDSFSSSSENEEIISLQKNKKVRYGPRTMSFFSKSFSVSDDESEQITNKNQKERSHNPHYHYRYKNCSKDFSADTATSDFDDLFSSISYSSDFSSDDY